MYVTVGTGISSCLVQDGVPYAGARGNALILASSPLTTVCTTCDAVLRPVLEEYAAGPALVARYNRAAAGRMVRAEQVLAAARAHDHVAADVVFTAGEALGVSVGWLVNVLDPAAVIVGGGLGLAGGLYWDSFVAATREVMLDLSEVAKADTKLMACLVALYQHARERQVAMRLQASPAVTEMAKVCRLNWLIERTAM